MSVSRGSLPIFMQCHLCQTSLSAMELNRVSGVNFCGLCASTSLAGSLPVIGAHLAVQRGRSFETNTTTYRAQLTFEPVLSSIRVFNLSFSREGMLSRVTNWLRSEIQVGDPLFDTNVTIRTKKSGRDGVKQLLQSEGLQSAILALVSGMDGESNALRFQNGEVTWVCSRRIPYAADEWQMIGLELVALAIHLRRGEQDERIQALTQETQLIQHGLDEVSPEPMVSSLSESLASARLEGERVEDGDGSR